MPVSARVSTFSFSGWSTSLGLMAALRADDPVARERFAWLYSTLFNHWFLLDRVPEGEWPDLRQEVFLAVTRALPDYRHEPGFNAFRGWLRVKIGRASCRERVCAIV